MAREPITIVGIPQTKAKLGKFGLAMEDSLAIEITLMGDRIVVGAKKLVPVKTGALQLTIRRDGLAKKTGTNILVRITAGGPSTPHFVAYANRVHEERIKYIEIPTLELTQQLPVRFKRSFSRAQRMVGG